MAEDKATAKKAASAEPTAEVTDAEVNTAPAQGGGEAPVRETIPTGNEAELDAVSTEDKKEELQEEARARGLDDSGTKQELVDRINEDNEKSMHKPEVLYPREED